MGEGQGGPEREFTRPFGEGDFSRIERVEGTSQEMREKQWKKEDEIGRHYDHLMEERKELTEKAEKLPLRDLSTVFDYEVANDEQIRTIRDEWVEKLRSETTFLKPLDKIGIELFKDDLTDQPAFEGERITFKSKDIIRRRVAEGRSVDGISSNFSQDTDIGFMQPDLRIQMWHFLKNGDIDPSSNILVHELLHRYHNKSGKRANRILTEAGAYYNGIFTDGSGHSMTRIADVLSKPREEEGYGMNKDKVIKALEVVSGMHGLGFPEDQINNLIATSHFDPKRQQFYPIFGLMKERMKKHGIDHLDQQALYDLLRINNGNQRMKARLAMAEVIESHFPLEELQEKKKATIDKRVSIPDYFVDGKKADAKKLHQLIVIPNNETYPYDPKGKRTGIIFGFFPTGEKYKGKETLMYQIGRFEADGKNSKLDFAKSAGEMKPFLDQLKQQGPKIDIMSKKLTALDSFYGDTFKDSALNREILRALISKEEAGEVLKELIEYFDNYLDAMEGQLVLIIGNKEYRKNPEETKKKVDSYALFLNKHLAFFNVLGLDLSKSHEKESEQASRVEELIGRVREKFDEEPK